MFKPHEHIGKIPTYDELEKLRQIKKIRSADVSPSRLGQEPDAIVDASSYPSETRKLGGIVIDGEALQAYVIGAVISYYHRENPKAKKKLITRLYLFEHDLSAYRKLKPSKN